MRNVPVLIEDDNISSAWCKVVGYILNHPGKEITPLILSLTGFDEKEAVRDALDADLAKREEFSITTVSETIFPESVYILCGEDREALYNQYMENLPRLKAIDKRNKRGIYFERLIAFENPRKPAMPVNQLDVIINGLKNEKGKRRSALQASLFDPGVDHMNSPYLGFPCLQQISCYKSENGGLILNAFYAVQLLHRKAYGNWLGLTNLGKFIAKEAGIAFERFNCYVGVEQLDGLTKADAKRFIALDV
ncbi:thymidylate synthase [Mucilaginibacter sp. SP1R1]|uniref:thymidylate synthase n=1 Tax=Mucilaginibacter sp. SP1R1 TaxID=2723091 RepID=UPI00160CF13E|nr:thymidylate synthase [Mucilaginibacter sp. SP1R1]MBB6149598.1 thymidylate synthase [Mucilaginibacter sp. SP1R1]